MSDEFLAEVEERVRVDKETRRARHDRWQRVERVSDAIPKPIHRGWWRRHILCPICRRDLVVESNYGEVGEHYCHCECGYEYAVFVSPVGMICG